MQTFIPFGLVWNVLKAPTAMLHRCQLCKEMVKEGELLMVNNGDERLMWMFTVAHLGCVKNLVEGRFQRLANEEVFITPKLTGKGPKVEVGVGANSFSFDPMNAHKLGVNLILSSVGIAFDDWAHAFLVAQGRDAIRILVAMRKLRGSRVIPSTLAADDSFLLRDCWNMLLEALEQVDGPLDPEVMKTWVAAFVSNFQLEDEGRPTQ